jgi:HD-GYP domain-containing protein (c-di-GMP phosphodiesterase class II)
MKEVANVMLYHHERFDGKGYPTGKEGNDTPLLSRIIAVADAFDAMTTERSYRTVQSLDSALTELNNGKWTQFDGDVVDCFVDLLESNHLKPKELNIALGLY